VKRGERLKSNPETTRAWKRRSAEKAAAKRPVRAPVRRSGPESAATGQRAGDRRLPGAPEPSASRSRRPAGAGAVERPPGSNPTSLSRASRKRSAAAADRRSRKAVRERSSGRCEVRVPGVCRGRATNFHHRQPRGMGGDLVPDDRPEKYLHICGSGTTGCHGWIESNRDDARRRGWLVPRPTDPAAVPWSPHDGRTR
jgi:hypothetical protein